MSEEETPGQGEEDDLTDFVPAVFARSAEEAESYRRLLDRHDIPAILGHMGPCESGSGITRGCPVLVPEVMLDDASRVIADRGPPAASAGPRGQEPPAGQDPLDLDDPDADDEDDTPEGDEPFGPPGDPRWPAGPE